MPLTIQYCSDLHLEFELNNKWVAKYPLEVKGDVLLLAGDIMPFRQIDEHRDFWDYVTSNYQAAYWIPGNHEYYGGDINERSGTMNEAIRSNVFLVNNTTVMAGDTAIICATMWSRLHPADWWDVRRAMSDFHVISDGGQKLGIDRYNELHEVGKQYILEALADNASKPTVVMTHHLPTMMNYPEKFKGDVLNQAFATEMYDIVKASGAACWIYGHTHCNTPDFTIGGTHLLCNQLGYVKYGEHKDFVNRKVFVVE